MPRLSVQVRGRRGGDRVAIELRSIAFLEPVHAYVEALVHPSARADLLVAAHHRAFIRTRLFGGLVALGIMPVHFAVRGAPTTLETIVFAWLVSPLLVAWYLSRTGAYERAHLLSAGMLAGLVTFVAGATGGIASFAAPWIAIVPLEAALSASRRVVIATIALSIAIMIGLWGIGAAGWLPPPPESQLDSSTLYLLGTLSAALYASAIAFGAGALARLGERVKLLVEARYHLLAQNMTDVITRHVRNGAVTFISPAAERLVGVPAAQLLAHGLFERVHVADRPAFLTAILDAATRGKSVSVEYRLRRGSLASEDNGSAEPTFIWVEMCCRAVEQGSNGSSGGTSCEVVAVTRDISRHKADALELETARAEAERANQAKSRFLAIVSHELRTPLNAIIGFSEMLTHERKMDLDAERRQDYARLIHDSGQHLLAVVNGILDVSRIESGHVDILPESFVIGPLVENCCEMMLLRAEQAGIRLTVELAPNLPEVVADKRALRQVLINLISNAIKFTDRGGSIEVLAHTEGGEFLLIVSDNGIGIAENDLSQLGDPFFQACSSYDRPYEGTGLGLSVVKGLVELHGGQLEIKSRLGEGTRVVARLPRDCGKVAKTPNPDVVARMQPRSVSSEIQKVKRSA
jgi:cell cycle sensor histidine kinase DivJ